MAIISQVVVLMVLLQNTNQKLMELLMAVAMHIQQVQHMILLQRITAIQQHIQQNIKIQLMQMEHIIKKIPTNLVGIFLVLDSAKQTFY
jgi:hypothetical protein